MRRCRDGGATITSDDVTLHLALTTRAADAMMHGMNAPSNHADNFRAMQAALRVAYATAGNPLRSAQCKGAIIDAMHEVRYLARAMHAAPVPSTRIPSTRARIIR
jgi:hypothetical protein